MKKARKKTAVRAVQPRQIATLRARLAIADETLRAIRGGEVDTVSVAGEQGRQVFTLNGAEHAYRVLIESMNEGALTLTADLSILYANESFARLVRYPLEQVIGGSILAFLSAIDRARLRPLMKRSGRVGAKILVELKSSDGASVPVQISLRPLVRQGKDGAALGLVVTDMTEARRNEGRLRALTHRVVQAQETERGRVALELHDNITQLLYAVAFSSQALLGKLSGKNGAVKEEAMKLHGLLVTAAEEVERISRNLRPSILDQLGLAAVLHETTADFTARTSVPVKLTGGPLPARLSAEAELTLYRILQEALKNVEQHARARHVTVGLEQSLDFVEMTIIDDGIGFDSNRHPAARRGVRGLGLLGMNERAAYARGELTVKSGLRAGTEIAVRIPRVLVAPAA